MSEKKIMTVAELSAYLRTIPNQNLPVYVQLVEEEEPGDGTFWVTYEPVDRVCVDKSKCSSSRLTFYVGPDDGADDDDLLDEDYDGSFLDDDDIPALNAAAANAEADELVRRAQADAAFYGVS